MKKIKCQPSFKVIRKQQYSLLCTVQIDHSVISVVVAKALSIFKPVNADRARYDPHTYLMGDLVHHYESHPSKSQCIDWYSKKPKMLTLPRLCPP